MKDLIEKLKNDRLSADEYSELKQFFNTASDEEIATLFPESTVEDDAGAISYQMISRMKNRIDAATGKMVSDYSRFGLYKKVSIAAAIIIPLLIVGISVLLFIPGLRNNADMCVIAAGENESSSVTLVDGSIIALNENSTLTIEGFTTKDRYVKFEGEAYFDISKDSGHPFRISTPAMTVEVFGTSFNLLSRTDSDFSELSLDKGKVVLTAISSDESITLTAGQSALFDVKKGVFTVCELNSETSTWKNNELLFYQAPPEYVIERLEQTYNVTIDEYLRSRMDKAFTGMLPSDNLQEAISIISNVYNVD